MSSFAVRLSCRTEEARAGEWQRGAHGADFHRARSRDSGDNCAGRLMTVDALVDHRTDTWTAGLHSLARVTAADAVLNDLRLAIERGDVAVGIRLPSETS